VLCCVVLCCVVLCCVVCALGVGRVEQLNMNTFAASLHSTLHTHQPTHTHPPTHTPDHNPQFDDPAESQPTSFRALDFKPCAVMVRHHHHNAGAGAGAGGDDSSNHDDSSNDGSDDEEDSILLGTLSELWEVPGAALTATAGAAAAVARGVSSALTFRWVGL